MPNGEPKRQGDVTGNYLREVDAENEKATKARTEFPKDPVEGLRARSRVIAKGNEPVGAYDFGPPDTSSEGPPSSPKRNNSNNPFVKKA